MGDKENEVILYPIIEHSTGLVSLGNYEELLKKVETFINNNSVFITISNADDERLCRKERTELNKARDAVKKARLAITKNLTETFTTQCKTIEKALDEASEKHTEALKALEAKEEDMTEELELIIKSTSPEAIKKVKAYAIKYGCEVKEN